MTARRFITLIFFLALTLGLGFLAGQVTAPNIPSWYNGLAKPSFNPPSWIFAPVWTALYIAMAVAVWRVVIKAGWRSKGLALWLIQLALNFAWSFIFFGAHDPGAALTDIAVLWLAIITTIAVFWRIDRLAAGLLVPYLGWVSFAGVLNYWIWQLNR